jgi:hypothetical protein
MSATALDLSFTRSTTEVLADVSQAQHLWKSPEILAIAVAVVKFFVEHDGAHFTDEVDLSFVRPEDKNLIGNTWLPLKNRGLLAMTEKWRRSTKLESKSRVVWQYQLASYSLAKEFLRRNNAPLMEKQISFL